MLTSVDLFSGIAGFTRALRGVATPLLYCDRDPAVIRTLTRLMARRAIPTAPIVDDVRDLAAITAATRGADVDLVTAGFPCVGFSVSGVRKGLKDDQSSLFHAASDVVAALRPKLVLFENVPGVLSAERDFRTIVARMQRLGYDLRWTTCSARDVGAPQIRNRWFCLAVRRGARVPRLIDFGRTARFPPAPRFSPVSSDPDKRDHFPARLRQLGNAIVPLAGRLAFARLLSGFEVMSVAQLVVLTAVPFRAVGGGDRTAEPPRHGYVGRQGYMEIHVPAQPRRAMPLRIDPAHHVPARGYAPRSRAALQEPLARSFWPTPRVSAAHASHVLTDRTVFDLATFALFVSHIDGAPQRRTRAGDCMDARFAEWLMGYPADWTA